MYMHGANSDIKSLIVKRLSGLKKGKKAKGIHSKNHALAKEVSEYCKEPQRFAAYLGIIKNIGHSKAYRIFSELKQNRDVTNRGKWFFYKSKS